MKKILIFIGVGLCSMGCFDNTFAVLKAEEPRNECLSTVVEAFSNADIEREKNLNTFLESKKTSIIAKTQGKNLTHFDAIYNCNLLSICRSLQVSKEESSLFTSAVEGCEDRSVADVEAQFSVSFESCRIYPESIVVQNILTNCENIAQNKLVVSRQETGKKVREVASLENQGILGTKILSIMQRMDILLEKTRAFALSFKLTVNDLGCTVPNPSS